MNIGNTLFKLILLLTALVAGGESVRADKVDVWVETTLGKISTTDVFVIVGTNSDGSFAMTNSVSSTNPPSAYRVTIANGRLSCNVPDKIQWKRTGSSSAYNFYSMAASNKLLYCTESDNGVRVGNGTNDAFKIDNGYIYNNDAKRYLGIFDSKEWRCYQYRTNTNIAGQTFKFYKKTQADATAITLAAACTDVTKYYGTFSSSSAFVVPVGLTVSEIKVENGLLQVSDYATGDIVPANTGVMVSAASAGDHLVEITSGGTSKLGNANMLKPSGSGITAAAMNVANTKFYRLTMHNGTQIGFWWGAENGAAFDLAANKAYLAVPDAAAARLQSLWLSDETEGITGLNREVTDDNQPVYDLQGRHIVSRKSANGKLQRGLYIMNGRKVVR